MKKGLLAVSFGTSFSETRACTIDAIERDLGEAFPERNLYRAWSSGFIRKKVRENEGLSVDSVPEALDRMIHDGITDLLVSPVFVGPGKEYGRLIVELSERRDSFEKIRTAVPLIAEEPGRIDMCGTLKRMFPEAADADRVVLMGHGVPDGDNSFYLEMNRLFGSEGMRNFYMGLVEAEPGLEDVRAWLAEEKSSGGKVVLAPFLIVAGDHVRNDMAGDSPSSWKNTLGADGWEVVPLIKGLGEYKEIRELFVKSALHAKEF